MIAAADIGFLRRKDKREFPTPIGDRSQPQRTITECSVEQACEIGLRGDDGLVLQRTPEDGVAPLIRRRCDQIWLPATPEDTRANGVQSDTLCRVQRSLKGSQSDPFKRWPVATTSRMRYLLDYCKLASPVAKWPSLTMHEGRPQNWLLLTQPLPWRLVAIPRP